MAAVSIAMLLAIAAIVIDAGSLFFARRALQSTDDAAALAAVQDPANADAVAASVFAQNGYSGQTLTVTTGTYTADESLSAENRFAASNSDVNAVRVRATIQKSGYFAALFGLSNLFTISTQSTAARLPTASFGAGTRLAELNGGLLNSVLGQLWGSNLSLSLVDYQSLVTTNVEALPFLNQLATDIAVTGDYSQLANASVTVGQIIQALAETASAGNAQGDPTAALLALQTLQLQVLNSTPMQLSDVIDLSPLIDRTIGGIPTDGEQGLQINMMSLLSASARTAASTSTISLGSAITIPVTNSTVTARLSAGNKMAQAADAQVGTSVHTGQIRMALTITLANVDLGVVTTNVQIPIYLEVAPGQAELTAMPCVPGGTLAQIDATSGTTSLGFGTVSDAALSDFSAPVTPVSAPIVSVSLLGIPIQVNISGSAGVGGSGPDTLPFTQDDIDSGTIKSPSNPNNTPFNDLSASTTLSTVVLGSPGLLAGTLNSQLTSLLAALNPVVTNAITKLNGPVNSVLTTLGVQLGTIDVRVFDTSCRTPTLVG